MNRIVLLGVALFVAAVGVALMGSDNVAIAGHGGCNGCSGASCDGGCGGAPDCCGRRHHRQRRCDGASNGCGGRQHRRRNRCCGQPDSCCGEVAPACCAVAAGPMQAPMGQAPGKEAPHQAPMGQAPGKEAPGPGPDQAPAK